MQLNRPQNNLPRLREAGEVHKKIMADVRGIITTDFKNVSTGDVNDWINDQIAKHGMDAAFKAVPGYEDAACISVNGAVVHGVPNDEPLRPGDYVTVDFGVSNQGFIVDAADTWIVGQEEQDELIQAAKDVRAAMIEKVIAGARAMDLALTTPPIAARLAKSDMYIMPHFSGHGVEKDTLHAIPCIPCVPVNKKMPTHDWEHQCLRERYRLQEGDVICIEPIVIKTTASRKKRFACSVMQDGWTVKLHDKKAIAVHCEHTIYVTKGEPEILA